MNNDYTYVVPIDVLFHVTATTETEDLLKVTGMFERYATTLAVHSYLYKISRHDLPNKKDYPHETVQWEHEPDDETAARILLVWVQLISEREHEVPEGTERLIIDFRELNTLKAKRCRQHVSVAYVLALNPCNP